MSIQPEQTKAIPSNRMKNARKWWKQGDRPVDDRPVERTGQGQPCPKCLLADLNYDSLFRLLCPNCGYVAECGAFT